MEKSGGMPMRTISDGEVPPQTRANRQTAGEEWHEFVDNTTLHGIRYVFFKRHFVLRLLWLILLLASGGYYIFTVYRAFNKFYNRPINTVLSRKHVDEMEFPAISICSLNFFALSKVLMTDDDPLFASGGLNISTCAVTAPVRGSRPCGLSLICCCSPAAFLNISIENCTSQYRQDLLDVISRSSHNPDMENFFRYYSQNITELLGPMCTFGWQQDACFTSDFVPNVTPWGMCYTFNSGVGGKVRKVDSGGVSYGLTIALDAQLPEYTQGKYSEGFKVLVHRPGEYVDEWEGINVAPGQHAVIAVSQQIIKNLPDPYSTKCVTKKLNMFSTYTSEGCLYECEAEAAIKSCGCRPAGYKGSTPIKTCITKEETICTQRAEAMLDEDLCGCEVPCDQVKYVTDVSYSKFPDRGTADVIEQSGNYPDLKYIRDNLVLLQIGFKSLSYEKYEQQPAYDSNSLFGEIGGNMGLFLGCSLLTICEFLDFFIGLLATRRRHIPHPA